MHSQFNILFNFTLHKGSKLEKVPCKKYGSKTGNNTPSAIVADPNPYVLGLPDPDPRHTDPASDPSIVKQKKEEKP
jgi:hypothetical protein